MKQVDECSGIGKPHLLSITNLSPVCLTRWSYSCKYITVNKDTGYPVQITHMCSTLTVRSWVQGFLFARYFLNCPSCNGRLFPFMAGWILCCCCSASCTFSHLCLGKSWRNPAAPHANELSLYPISYAAETSQCCAAITTSHDWSSFSRSEVHSLCYFCCHVLSCTMLLFFFSFFAKWVSCMELSKFGDEAPTSHVYWKTNIHLSGRHILLHGWLTVRGRQRSCDLCISPTPGPDRFRARLPTTTKKKPNGLRLLVMVINVPSSSGRLCLEPDERMKSTGHEWHTDTKQANKVRPVGSVDRTPTWLWRLFFFESSLWRLFFILKFLVLAEAQLGTRIRQPENNWSLFTHLHFKRSRRTRLSVCPLQASNHSFSFVFMKRRPFSRF